MFLVDMWPGRQQQQQQQTTTQKSASGLLKFWTNKEIIMTDKLGNTRVVVVDDADVSVTEFSDDEESSSNSYGDGELVVTTTPTLVVLAKEHDESHCSTESYTSDGSYSVLTETSVLQQQQEGLVVQESSQPSGHSTKPKPEYRDRKYVKQPFRPAPLYNTPATGWTDLGATRNLSQEDRQALWLIWSTLQVHAQEVQRLDERAAIGKRMLRKLYSWAPKRVRECLQCPPEGRGGVLADMARHILAYKMGNLCTSVLQKMVQHDVLEIACELVTGMKDFLASALPKTTPEQIRASSPRAWSLLARAWTESMEECYEELWTLRMKEAWGRLMTLLLRSIFKVLWYKEADELNEKMVDRKAGENKSRKPSKPKKMTTRATASSRNMTNPTKAQQKLLDWAGDSSPNLTHVPPKKTKKK